MFEKLVSVDERYNSIAERLSDSSIMSDQAAYTKLSREYKSLSPLINKYHEYMAYKSSAEEAKTMLDSGGLDKDFRDLAYEELQIAKRGMESATEELKILLLPRDPNDDRNVIIEIRSGAGGDEAALFANSLLRMYSMYAESCRWKVDMLTSNQTELGGYKEVSFMIIGDGAYSRFKYESGVHRVQRVPDTESQGRIHTSTVTVAVLAEAEEVEIDIKNSDLKIDTFRSGGAGGQHVNTTDSAIRITHLPTGTVVECQDERSQTKNKDKALKILRSRIYERMQQEANEKIASDRKTQVGTGDRSERIRTYNYPQGRMSDHRINLTLYKLEAILNGDMSELIDLLITAHQAEMLKAESL